MTERPLTPGPVPPGGLPTGFRAVCVVLAIIASGMAVAAIVHPPRRYEATTGRTPAWPTVRLDLNQATAAELSILPGVGPALSARILEHRRRHGPFTRPGQIERVPGIGPVTMERIAPYVRVGDTEVAGVASP